MDLITHEYEIFYERAIGYYVSEEYEDAIECFDKAIEIKPDFADAWNSKGYGTS